MKRIIASIMLAVMMVCCAGAGLAEKDVLDTFTPVPVAAGGHTDPVPDDYSFQHDPDAIEETANSVFYVEVYDGQDTCLGTGSGFVTFDEHLFVTNQHVIEGATYLKIFDDDNNVFFLDRVAVSDEANDVAILFFPEGKQYRSLDQNASMEGLKRGQPVVTMGSPKGFAGTVSTGIISALPTIGGRDFIQTSAPISHGSSGGCMFDDHGKVIGINSYGIDDGQNINFAIPIGMAQRLYGMWNKQDYETLGTKRSWDTVGFVGTDVLPGPSGSDGVTTEG